MKKGMVICGFPGVGKSSAELRCRDINDIEVSSFRYPADWENINEPEKMRHDENPNWVTEYVDQIEVMSSRYGYSYNLVSTHGKVREEMDARSIPYIIVAPMKELKDEYLARYLQRGSDAEFIISMNDHWDEYLDEIEKCGMPVIHLKSGQFISDILPIPQK